MYAAQKQKRFALPPYGAIKPPCRGFFNFISHINQIVFSTAQVLTIFGDGITLRLTQRTNVERLIPKRINT